MNELNDIYEKLGRIEGTQKLMLDEMRASFMRINGTIGKHEKKINELETFRDESKGKAAVIGASAGFSAMVLWEIIKNKFFK